MAEKFFKKDFVGLAEACSVFGKTLKENELPSHCSFSDENILKKYAEDGYCFITVPQGITVGDVCSTNLFAINLSPQEIVKLKKEVIRPGGYFVRKEPRHVSFGEMNMRDSGFVFEKNPRLGELMYVYALVNLLGKRKMLIQRICVLCQDEVVRRGLLTPVCFKKNTGTAIEIGAWRSQMKPMNVMQVKKVG